MLQLCFSSLLKYKVYYKFKAVCQNCATRCISSNKPIKTPFKL